MAFPPTNKTMARKTDEENSQKYFTIVRREMNCRGSLTKEGNRNNLRVVLQDHGTIDHIPKASPYFLHLRYKLSEQFSKPGCHYESTI